MSELPKIEQNNNAAIAAGIGRSNELLQGISSSLTNQSRALSTALERMREQATRDANAKSLSDNAVADAVKGSSQGAMGADGVVGAPGGKMAGLGALLGGTGGLIGGAISGIGVGGGALLAGAGLLAAGGGHFLEKLSEFDGKAIRANVKELIGIKDDFGGVGGFFLEGGTFAVTLSAIGAGLGIFAVGGSAAVALDKWDGDGKWTDSVKTNVKNLLSLSDEITADRATILMDGGVFFATLSGLGVGLGVFGLGGSAAAALTKFETGDWATTVKDQVKTLLEIPDLPNAGLGGAFGFIGTMGGLATGLAVFALGRGVENVAAVGTEGLKRFTGEPFADKVKDQVKTLLEIPDLPNANLGGVFSFIGTMGGLAVGLAAFALGKGVEGGAEIGQEALTYFTNQAGFATRVKTEVATLLEIPSLPGAGVDTIKFVATMVGLATGLAAFALGKGVEGGATAMQGAITYFTDKPFAERIKDEVSALLTITNNQTDDGSTFSAAMGNIAKGLLKFSTGEFGASFVSMGSSIVNFLTGADSPIEKVMSIAENADKLTQGANALGSIAENLNKFQAINFDGSNFDIRGFAEDLKESVPSIEKAIMGDDGGWFGTPILGLASPEVDYDGAKRNIAHLREALGMGTIEMTPQTRALAMGTNDANTSPVVNAPVINNVTNNYYNTSSSSATLAAGGGAGGAGGSEGTPRPDRQ